MKRIVVLVSGRGSNMTALADRCAAEGWPARASPESPLPSVSESPGAVGASFTSGVPTRVGMRISSGGGLELLGTGGSSSFNATARSISRSVAR